MRFSDLRFLLLLQVPVRCRICKHRRRVPLREARELPEGTRKARTQQS